MSRKVPEWIGKNDDEDIPPRVKLRIFEAAGGRCYCCTLRIGGSLLPEYDHVIALTNGGENRESNIKLICSKCHGPKTKKDVAEKSHIYHKRLKATGIRKRKRSIPGRKFDGTPIPSRWKD